MTSSSFFDFLSVDGKDEKTKRPENPEKNMSHWVREKAKKGKGEIWLVEWNVVDAPKMDNQTVISRGF